MEHSLYISIALKMPADPEDATWNANSNEILYENQNIKNWSNDYFEF